jgi:hypothetical protein
MYVGYSREYVDLSIHTLTVTVIRVIAQGVSCTATITDTFAFPISVVIVRDSLTRDLWQLSPGSEAGETWREMVFIIANELSLSFYSGIFNVPQNLMKWDQRIHILAKGSHAMDSYGP